MGNRKTRVILVTDGDRAAQASVEAAAKNVGGRVISASAGNPTPLSGEAILELVRMTPYDPVLVMVDDRGNRGKGPGEQALEALAHADDVSIIGAVAVAADTTRVAGAPVQTSVDLKGRIVEGAVDKEGVPDNSGDWRIRGDTVDVLAHLGIPVLIGMGDPGKVSRDDSPEQGAKITTRAVQAVLEQWEQLQSKQRGNDASNGKRNDAGSDARSDAGRGAGNGGVDGANAPMVT